MTTDTGNMYQYSNVMSSTLPRPFLWQVSPFLLVVPQVVSFGWPPAARCIGMDRPPQFQERCIQPPRGFNLVVAHKEGLVACQDIEQKRLVPIWKGSKGSLVAEMEAMGLQANRLSRRLYFEMEIKPLVRLQRDHQSIGVDCARVKGLKESHRGAPEIDCDAADSARQSFPRTQLERYTLPTPVGDLQTQGNESFGLRVRRNTGLLLVAGHLFAVHFAR